MSLRFGSLFTGIGGFDLGLERAGMTCAWQVEVDPYARGILERHWPEVPKRGDIRLVEDGDLAPVDLICGGFPCQPVSRAGRRMGTGDRRWLWPEMFRLIRLLRPRFGLVENVLGIRKHGLGAILRDLAAIGYDAEWDCLPAAFVGAPHPRDRLWLLAYASCGRRRPPETPIFAGRAQPLLHAWWRTEPAVGRVAHGIPDRLALRALGNSIVPQIAEQIGRAILAVEKAAVAA